MFDEKEKEQPTQEQPSALDNLEAQTQPEVAEQVAAPTPPSDIDKNMKRLRDDRAKAERERDDMMRLVQQMSQQQQNAQQPIAEENYELNVNENDLAEGKHLQKLQSRINKLESTLRSYHQDTTNRIEESRIKARYPDFEEVVSNENVEALKLAHPEIFNTLIQSPDLYSKGVSAYKIIKQLGLSDSPVRASHTDDRERIQANAAKPKSPSTVGAKASSSSLGQAGAYENSLTPARKKQLYEEMMAFRHKG